jgi:hypothetical protein
MVRGMAELSSLFSMHFALKIFVLKDFSDFWVNDYGKVKRL